MSRISLLAAALMVLPSCLAEEDDVTRSRATLETPECGHFASAIIDSTGASIGYVVASNTEENLLIDVEAALGVSLKNLYLYAGPGPVPANSVGNVYPEFFPYQQAFVAPFPTRFTFAIPLADVGVEPGTCGDVVVSLHALAVQLASDGTVLKKHAGWAFGDIVFPHGSYATGYGFHYTLCCEPPPPVDAGCTLTQGYWKTHNEYATSKGLRRDWPAPHDELDTLCGASWLSILGAPPEGGNAWIILAHQYIAAALNVATGASTTAQVDQALADAEAFLEGSCWSIHASDAPDEVDTASVLDAYNNGDLGPSHCE